MRATFQWALPSPDASPVSFKTTENGKHKCFFWGEILRSDWPIRTDLLLEVLERDSLKYFPRAQYDRERLLEVLERLVVSALRFQVEADHAVRAFLAREIT
jgi:hypothetical protein